MEVKWGFDFGNNQFFRCKIIEKKKMCFRSSAESTSKQSSKLLKC